MKREYIRMKEREKEKEKQTHKQRCVIPKTVYTSHFTGYYGPQCHAPFDKVSTHIQYTSKSPASCCVTITPVE
jgi:hypothetical protein